METLKNIGTGAAALGIVLAIVFVAALIGVLALELLDWLALHYPNAGPASFGLLIALAILWWMGRTIRRQAA